MSTDKRKIFKGEATGMEARNLELLEEYFMDTELTAKEEKTLRWLAGYEECSLRNIMSAFSRMKSGPRA